MDKTEERYKVWLVIEDLKAGQDVQDIDAIYGIAYRGTLEDAVSLVQSIGAVVTEIRDSRGMPLGRTANVWSTTRAACTHFQSGRERVEVRLNGGIKMGNNWTDGVEVIPCPDCRGKKVSK